MVKTAIETYDSNRSAMKISDVQNRRDLAKYLSQSMSHEYLDFSDDEITQTSTYVKSYLIESHSDDSNEFGNWGSELKLISPAEDQTLLRLEGANEAGFIIDRRDERFCVVHSVAKTSQTDDIISNLTDGRIHGLDRAWLPTNFLLGSRKGQLRGFKFSHQPVLIDGQPVGHSPIAEEGFIELPTEYKEYEALELNQDALPPTRPAEINEAEPEYNLGYKTTKRKFGLGFRSKLSISDHENALNDYRAIQTSGIFTGRQALDWIQFRSSTSEVSHVTNGVYASGKIVGNGTSVALHLLTVEQIRSAYSIAIQKLENDYAIGWIPSSGGRVLNGEPLIFGFPASTERTDLEVLARSIFRASRPFRLFGIPLKISDRRVDVEGIDLHTGHRFSVEITSEWMRLYLPVGACGNLVARLYTNLQRYVSSEVTFSTGSGETIFGEGDAA